jgi:hypothetical protein
MLVVQYWFSMLVLAKSAGGLVEAARLGAVRRVTQDQFRDRLAALLLALPCHDGGACQSQ